MWITKAIAIHVLTDPHFEREDRVFCTRFLLLQFYENNYMTLATATLQS